MRVNEIMTTEDDDEIEFRWNGTIGQYILSVNNREIFMHEDEVTWLYERIVFAQSDSRKDVKDN